MRTSSLRRKFIIFVIIIITPIATSNIISLLISKKINDNYNHMLNKMSTTNEIKTSINTAFYNFNKYILTNSEECIELYEESYKQAIQNVGLLQRSSDLESRYILRDLENSMISFKTSGDKAIQAYKHQGGIDSYYDDYVATKEIASYCSAFISKLSDSYLNYNNKVYNNLKDKERFIYKILAAYIATAILISIIYTLYFLKNILDKLRELVDTSQKVSSGDFQYNKGKKTYIYELDILSEAFSTMLNNIKKYINSIQENAELERKLRDEEMKILKYQNALKLSQLKILQAQINPHFLFNTLNCISQTAIKEKADKTESLIRSVSGILRYSLSMMDRNATLEEEINVVKQYIYIQELRYDDRVKFNLKVDYDLAKVKVPGMTLQPFVENAFIHGIEPKEEGGAIDIVIHREGDRCIVLIGDDGCGIDEDTLEKITSEDSEQQHIGHTTGMGIKSVVERLQILYEEKNIFSIESERGSGTRIYLKIPIKELKEIC
jgi:two-component system, sensor histidine kinase YesM